MTHPAMLTLPYKIAVLCYLYDEAGRLLLIHRAQDPNRGMYSPIGGKLEAARGESPHDCAAREIREEAGLGVSVDELHLSGIVAETAYEGQTHWLLFLFELMRPVGAGAIERMSISEGTLEWVPVERVAELDIPETDRKIMWPLVCAHRRGFFVVHIDCTDGAIRASVQESRKREGTQGRRDEGTKGGARLRTPE